MPRSRPSRLRSVDDGRRTVELIPGLACGGTRKGGCVPGLWTTSMNRIFALYPNNLVRAVGPAIEPQQILPEELVQRSVIHRLRSGQLWSRVTHTSFRALCGSHGGWRPWSSDETWRYVPAQTRLQRPMRGPGCCCTRCSPGCASPVLTPEATPRSVGATRLPRRRT